MQLTFDILDWKAWAPTKVDSQPDVTVIPALLRRRLSFLARTFMSVAMPLVDKYGAMPLVYVSRHGDLSRTLGLLDDLAKGNPLSPTAFSLSVHNATAGLFSIHQGLTKNVTAISCGLEDLIPALLESLGQCNASEPRVLCVFCDEPPPPIYSEQINQPEHPYALALVISLGDGWRLGAVKGCDVVEANNSPQSLQLLSLLKNDVKNLFFLSNSTAWQLSQYS